jgi:hypothetical protein
MESIINSDEAYSNFDFKKLVLTKPTQVSGGNYFIRFLLNNSPLYVQPPKCSTKQGIIKAGAGKRYYTDLMFTNENETFINWMEKLENYCQQYIYENREKWFDGEMELHDIENYFTSPLKLYKSGKYYIVRINVSTVLGKPILKIYDENEVEVRLESIDDKMGVMTILEIQGIKCSSRSFQIEIELKQMMVLKQTNLFEKCLFKTQGAKPTQNGIALTTISSDTNVSNFEISIPDSNVEIEIEKEIENENLEEFENQIESENQDLLELKEPSLENIPNETIVEKEEYQNHILEQVKNIDDIEEVEFHLEELPESESLHIKERNDVYYELYREAKRKAKIARDFAISSYLEAKEIKNTYMLDEIDDDDDSDDGLNFEDEL